MSSVKAYLQLARWPNALLAAFAVLAASQVGHVEGEFIPDPVLGAMLAALCLTVTANSSNDAADSEIDRVAHPERPIPRGAFQVKEARAIALSAALGGEIFATLASMWLGIISVFAIALMFLYSWRIKRYGVAGNLEAKGQALELMIRVALGFRQVGFSCAGKRAGLAGCGRS